MKLFCKLGLHKWSILYKTRPFGKKTPTRICESCHKLQKFVDDRDLGHWETVKDDHI